MYSTITPSGKITNPAPLPKNNKNISGFNMLPPEMLLDHGYYPYIEPEYDTSTHRLGELKKVGNTVTRNVVIKPKPTAPKTPAKKAKEDLNQYLLIDAPARAITEEMESRYP